MPHTVQQLLFNVCPFLSSAKSFKCCGYPFHLRKKCVKDHLKPLLKSVEVTMDCSVFVFQNMKHMGVLCMKTVFPLVRGTKALWWCREFFCCVLFTLQEEQKLFCLPVFRSLKNLHTLLTWNLSVPPLQGHNRWPKFKNNLPSILI